MIEATAKHCDACKRVCEVIWEFDTGTRTLADNKSYWDPSSGDPSDANFFSVRLGSYGDVRRRVKCHMCKTVAQAYLREGSKDDEDIFFSALPYALSIGKLGLRSLEPRMKWVPGSLGRIADANLIDFALLRSWLQYCEKHHGDSCAIPRLPAPDHDIYLVDVEENCLVLAGSNSSYIALSYVWGAIESAQTTEGNLDSLMTPGSLTNDSEGFSIPTTIRDAFRMVSLLGKRYLWVDRLSIVQDGRTKQLYLNSMASIFANACLTIVAAEGTDAAHGLRGIGGSSSPRIFPHSQIDFEHRDWKARMLLQSPHHLHERIETETWRERGWTMQEEVFSRRILCMKGVVTWTCPCAVWSEARLDRFEPPYPETAGFVFAKEPQWPDLYSYFDLVRLFNRRKLTYDSDVMDAFAGIASLFCRQFLGGCLFGIPEFFFDFCIGWRSVGQMRRRTDCGTSSLGNKLPSWSWVGWEGVVKWDEEPWTSSIYTEPYGQPKTKGRGTSEFKPLIQWHKSSLPDTPMTPVRNEWYVLKCTFADRSRGMAPLGWTRGLSASGRICYKHKQIPSISFRYPIPVQDDAEILMHDQRFLRFTAWRGWLSLDPHNPPTGAYVQDHEGILFHLDSVEKNPDKRCELIALHSRFDGGENKTIYKVMQIERVDNICYRKGIATIDSDIWEALDLEEIDVVLG
jgi:hypothetical protein